MKDLIKYIAQALRITSYNVCYTKLLRVQHVTPCMECHSPHRWTEHDAPIESNMVGADQVILAKGLPGRVVAPNISSDPDTGASKTCRPRSRNNFV